MNSPFANRRKPRKIGGGDEDDGNTEGKFIPPHEKCRSSCGTDTEPVVKRPSSLKSKQKSKLRLSFGPGETSMADGDDTASEVITPKRPGLGRRVLEKNALQRTPSTTGSSSHLPFRVGQEQDGPSYGEDYLKELRDSTPSTPKHTDTDGENERKELDITAKFGELIQTSGASAIPSEAEIREKKARRARLATEQDYISLEGGEEGEEDYMAVDHRKEDTRLVRDDEDFAEGFDEYVEDGKISLGRKAEREQQRRQREQMRDLIDDAEGSSEEEDSDAERNAAYEASQTRAGMDGMERDRRGASSRAKTPPKVSSLPSLAGVLGQLRGSLAEAEGSKKLLLVRMEELRKEKADIAVREVEIQTLIKDAGEQYEKLRLDAGLAPGGKGLPGDATPQDRGLESLGHSAVVSRVDSGAE